MGTGLKRLLLVDAVAWSNAYPQSHPLRNVYQWYARHFQNGTQLSTVSAEEFSKHFKSSEWDGVLISGSPRDAYMEDDFTRNLMQQIERVDIPMLGVCYGHQIIARALGAKVGKEPNGLELGNSEVQFTEAGKNSPIFAGLSSPLNVLQSHGDAVLEIPPSLQLLARNEHTHVQAFQYGEKTFGVQFHPETDPGVLNFLWQPRLGTWKGKANFNLSDRLTEMKPAPDAVKILHNFVQIL